MEEHLHKNKLFLLTYWINYDIFIEITKSLNSYKNTMN
jgi:hypothetical protein